MANLDLAEITNWLDEITGAWAPTGRATAEDLAEARLALARSLARGLSPQALGAGQASLASPPPGSLAQIEAVIQKLGAVPTPSAPALSEFSHLRSSGNLNPAAYAAVAGMKVGRTFGPFMDADGVEHWVDLIPVPKNIPIASDTRGVLAYLIVPKLSPGLAAGSIWLVAAGIAGAPPSANGLVGLSFSSGTALQAGQVTVSSSGVVIGAGGTLTLTLTLEPPTAPVGPPGVGPDAVQMTLALPQTVTLVLSESGAAFTVISGSSATVYGTSFTLTRNAAPPTVLTVGFDYLLFPCDPSITQFAFQKVLSNEVIPSGLAPILAAGWALPILPGLSPSQLGDASSAGSLALELGGARLEIPDLSSPVLLSSLSLVLLPGSIWITAVNGPRDVLDTLTLWTAIPPSPSVAPTPAQRSSEIDLTIPRGAGLLAIISTAFEALALTGKARCNVDRPLTADGSRLWVAFSTAEITFARVAFRLVLVTMSVPDLAPNALSPHSDIALENVLLEVGPAVTARMRARFSGTSLVGILELHFDHVQILPILPDPYASANAAMMPFPGTLKAVAAFTQQPGAVLTFQLLLSSQAAEIPSRIGPADVLQSALTLLDLSSNADQFGVSFIFARYLPYAAALDGNALAFPQQLMDVYALPGISWEPVVDQSQDTWLNAYSPDDGVPTSLQVNTVNLVRMEPNVALPAFAQAAANADTNAFFTLPFGLTANLQMTSANPSQQRPSYTFIQANYPRGMSAARQLSIQAQAAINVGDPALPGNTTTGSPLPVPLNSTVYGVLALGNDPLGAAQFFDQQFASPGGSYPEIPVKRIDLSGYGTSMFSDWQNQDLSFVGVVRSRFEVLVGRTAYELVQIASVILPWSIRITRTIIFDRFSTGLVVRHDSGWKAVGRGSFELLQSDQLLPGAVSYLQNIHNITVGSGPTLTLNPPDITRTLEFVPVTFDADVAMASGVTAQANGSATTLVAATQIQGYAQLTVGPVASAPEILVLMQKLPNGVSGSMGAIVNVGSAPSPASPRFTFNVSSLTVKATRANVTGQAYPALGLALNGVPRLPRDGAWSIARRGQFDTTPATVDPTFPVPLIFGTNNDNNPQWRMLGPEDALSAITPGTVYGLMQGTGTSKSLFENPVIDNLGGSLLLDPGLGVPQPNLADLGSLLGSAGIFPNLANVLQIPTSASDVLNLAQDGFQKTFDWPIQKPDGSFLGDEKLLDIGVVSLNLQYHGPDSSGSDTAAHATLILNADPPPGSPRWSLAIDRLSMAVFVQGFGSDALLTIHGGFSASETQKAGFNNIQIAYGSALSLVTNIISGLTTLVQAIGGAVNLDVGFSDNKLTVDDGFALPTIPLGLGEIKDIAIDLGLAISIPDQADFHVELGTQQKPFTWIVDPLAGTGAIILGTTNGDLGITLEAGIGAALAIDLAVASGSASIILELAISTNQSPFALTATLVGNASVDVLGGLASASLTLAASITIVPHWPTPSGLPDVDHPLPDAADFTAAVAVGIHISIAWVVSVDFDGSWSFNQNIPLHLPSGIL